jgi:hypothetical protein
MSVRLQNGELWWLCFATVDGFGLVVFAPIKGVY